VANGTMSKGHRDNAVAWLNDPCGYRGAMPVAELKKGHVKTWLEGHSTWQSTATHRSVVAIVLAAFNYAEEQYEVLRAAADAFRQTTASNRATGFDLNSQGHRAHEAVGRYRDSGNTSPPSRVHRAR